MRNILITLFMILGSALQAQELACTVTVNADKIPGSNRQVFKTLEQSLSEYINQTRWTDNNFKPQERIQCGITITILEQPNTNDFKGTIQVQASRPVYNSSYLTPIFNMRDEQFSFSYTEYEPLQYNENSFDSNLVSVVTFYVYTILGLDADTFKLNGGDKYYDQAENVVNQAQQSSFIGWNNNDGDNTRFRLIDEILAQRNTPFRRSLYQYHIKALDIMSQDKAKAKQRIASVINDLSKINNTRRNSFLVRVFMDAKSEEIIKIFSGGPNYDVSRLRDQLIKLSPVNLSKWNKLK